MDKNSFNNQEKTSSLDKKLQDIKIMLSDKEKCAEIARKLSEYISSDNNSKS